jgi:hypothetical protein
MQELIAIGWYIGKVKAECGQGYATFDIVMDAMETLKNMFVTFVGSGTLPPRFGILFDVKFRCDVY